MKKKVLWAVLCCIIIVAGCGENKDKGKKDTAQEHQCKELEDCYLSYTCTSSDLMVFNGTYDFVAKEQTNNGVITDLTSQYSLAVYDEQSQNVLYTAMDENGDSQVYEKNLESEEVTPITDNLWGINYIVPRENDILIVGLEKGSHVLALWKYIRSSQEIERVNFGVENTEQLSVWNMYLDPKTEEIYLAAFDDIDSSNRLEAYNNDNDNQDGKGSEFLEKYYFFSYGEGEAELLFTKEMPNSYNLLGNKSAVVYSDDKKDESVYYRYDLKTGQEKEVDLDGIQYGWIYLSEDGEILYFLDGTGGDYQIFAHNMETGEKEPLPGLDMKIRINCGNMMILKKSK